MVLLVLLLPKCPPPVKPATTWKAKFFELDPFGFFLIATSLICLLLAIQFGGQGHAWGSGAVTALFVVGGTFGLAFVGFQIWRGDQGTIPPQIISQRSILAGTVASLGIGPVLVLLAFYLPIWFQVVQGKSPQDSGLALIPLLLSLVIAVIASGIVTSKIGYYMPSLILGAAIAIVGTGLISTWSVDVGSGKWIGFQVHQVPAAFISDTLTDKLQILAGLGLGLVLQGPNIAAQIVLSKQDVSIGLSIINLANFLGSTVFVAVGQALLQSKLVKSLKPILPDADLSEISSSGATSIRDNATGDQLRAVLVGYNDAIRFVWYLALGLACLVLLASFGMEWRSVKGQTPLGGDDKIGGRDSEKSPENVEV